MNVDAKFHHNSPLSSVIFIFQNLEPGTASTDIKCYFAISWAKFGNPSIYILSIVMSMQNFIKIYQKVPGIRLVFFFFFFFFFRI